MSVSYLPSYGADKAKTDVAAKMDMHQFVISFLLNSNTQMLSYIIII